MPKFFEDITLQGSELQNAVLQNNSGDLSSFLLPGRMYWDSRNDVGTWHSTIKIPGHGDATVMLDYPNVGRIRYWANPRNLSGTLESEAYATVATLWDLDRLATWADNLIGGSGLSVNPYSLWGNSANVVNGGASIPAIVGSLQLQIPVALITNDPVDPKTIAFKKAFFYGKLTGNGTNKTFTFTHNMGTRELVVVTREFSTGKIVEMDLKFPSINTLELHFDTAPGNGALFYVLAVGVSAMIPDPGDYDSYYVAAVGST